jgi:hypothetical protein
MQPGGAEAAAAAAAAAAGGFISQRVEGSKRHHRGTKQRQQLVQEAACLSDEDGAAACSSDDDFLPAQNQQPADGRPTQVSKVVYKVNSFSQILPCTLGLLCSLNAATDHAVCLQLTLV